MLQLPVSGRHVRLLPLTGAEEIALVDQPVSPVRAGLDLIGCLARTDQGEAVDAGALCVTDFEVALLGVHQAQFGNALSSDFACPACGERVEIRIAVPDYVAALRPRRPGGVTADEDPAWQRLDGARFRLPTAADQAQVEDRADAAARLSTACIASSGHPAAVRRRIERAMAAMAPEASRDLVGRCPACEAAVRAFLHVPSFVIAGLRRAAADAIHEIHLLAGAYHWAEAAILAMPSARRRLYAEHIRDEGRPALPLAAY